MDELRARLGESARERLALIWTRRVVGEHQSTARFAAYAQRMRQFGVPQRIQDEAFAASEEERVHEEVCQEMAHRLGAGEIAVVDHDFTPPESAGPENLLADMVAFCCVAETLNVASLSAALRDTRNQEIRRATRKILADEVKHGRLGWAFLAWARSQGHASLLAPHVPHMLWGAVPPIIFAEEPVRADEAELRAMGDPPMRDRRDVFVRTTHEVIFAGLETHGVTAEPGRAWMARPQWPGGDPIPG